MKVQYFSFVFACLSSITYAENTNNMRDLDNREPVSWQERLEQLENRCKLFEYDLKLLSQFVKQQDQYIQQLEARDALYALCNEYKVLENKKDLLMSQEDLENIKKVRAGLILAIDSSGKLQLSQLINAQLACELDENGHNLSTCQEVTKQFSDLMGKLVVQLSGRKP